jgi:hypothetical protein
MKIYSPNDEHVDEKLAQLATEIRGTIFALLTSLK